MVRVAVHLLLELKFGIFHCGLFQWKFFMSGLREALELREGHKTRHDTATAKRQLADSNYIPEYRKLLVSFISLLSNVKRRDVFGLHYINPYHIQIGGVCLPH